MPFPRTARLASVLLGIVYLLFSLACVPGMVAAPTIYAQYGSFFEQFCLFCGASALYSATEKNAVRARVFGRFSRLGLGVCAISFAVAQAVYLRLTAGLVPKWIPPSQMFWALFTTVAFALAATAILIDLRARLAISLMTLMLALFGVVVWIPIVMAHPGVHGSWSELTLTFLMTGASWMVAEIRSS